MREILFKAKAINRDKGYHRTKYKNGDWVYGLVTRLYDEIFENLPAEMTNENGVSGIEIDHNTICQYTGLTDKNGNKIWENDVVVYDNSPYNAYCEQHTGQIIHRHGCLCYKFLLYGSVTYKSFLSDDFFEKKCEVIGNIFDNPELIGEQNG